MIHVEPLQRPISWKGKRYLKGCTQIPEDLAIALNLMPQTEPKSTTVADLEDASSTPHPTPDAQPEPEPAPEPPTPKPQAKHRRSRKDS